MLRMLQGFFLMLSDGVFFATITSILLIIDVKLHPDFKLHHCHFVTACVHTHATPVLDANPGTYPAFKPKIASKFHQAAQFTCLLVSVA